MASFLGRRCVTVPPPHGKSPLPSATNSRSSPSPPPPPPPLWLLNSPLSIVLPRQNDLSATGREGLGDEEEEGSPGRRPEGATLANPGPERRDHRLFWRFAFCVLRPHDPRVSFGQSFPRSRVKRVTDTAAGWQTRRVDSLLACLLAPSQLRPDSSGNGH